MVAKTTEQAKCARGACFAELCRRLEVGGRIVYFPDEKRVGFQNGDMFLMFRNPDTDESSQLLSLPSIVGTRQVAVLWIMTAAQRAGVEAIPYETNRGRITAGDEEWKALLHRTETVTFRVLKKVTISQ